MPLALTPTLLSLRLHAARHVPAWRIVQQEGDATLPGLRTLWQRLFTDLRRATPRGALREAIRRGNLLAATGILAEEQDFILSQRGRVLLLLLTSQVMNRTADALVPGLALSLGLPQTWTYRPQLPEAQQAAALEVAEQMRHILSTTTRGTRAALRIFPAWIVPEVIGLTARQMATIDRERATWQAGHLNRERQRRRLRALVAQGLAQRVEQISRTQGMSIAVLAQQQLWEQAERSGFLDADIWQRAWMTAPGERTCPQCRPMNGQRRGLHEPFASGSERLLSPPLHAQCRCVCTLVPGQESV